MKKRVGYFSGTDTGVLTGLVCEGYDTIPVSNGRDNHGQHVRLINEQNRYAVLIAPVHKIFTPEDCPPDDITYQDVFRLCRLYSIPLLIGVPARLEAKARTLLGDPPEIVRMVEPSKMFELAIESLAD